MSDLRSAFRPRRYAWFLRALLITFSVVSFHAGINEARSQGIGAGTVAGANPASIVDPTLPAWLTPLSDLPETDSRPNADSPSPFRVRLIEYQSDVASQAEFLRYAYRVESEAGLQQAGQLSVEFSPEYQTLKWHHARIWRDGQPREALDASSVQILRQEPSAERFLYHGRMTALLILHDLRVGDVIDFAYTRTGQNPFLGDRYSQVLGSALSSPVDRLVYRIRSPKNRPLKIAPHGGFDLTPQISSNGDFDDYRWAADGLKAIQAYSDAPVEVSQFPFVQITEVRSWSEVRDWARPLFAAADMASPLIAQRAREITSGLTTTSEKANALLRFVQEDIRYLGLQIKESTHRPTPPATVLERRFGDCKDKSLLLVALLREIGVEAEVALVNSTRYGGLAGLQPSPIAFDHAIVRAHVSRAVFFNEGRAGSTPQGSASGAPISDRFAKKFGPYRGEDTEAFIWLDPTLTAQGGAFEGRNIPDYGRALLLGDESNDLAYVQVPAATNSKISTQEVYHVYDYTSPARLEITTTYRGSSADAYRYYRGLVDAELQNREFTSLLERFYPKVKAVGPLRWEDDREGNILTRRATYELPDFWITDEKSGYRRIEIYPWSLSQLLPRTESTQREVPLDHPWPADWSQNSTLHMPKDWPDQADSHQVVDEAFDFTYNSKITGPTVEVSYNWRARKSQVAPERMAEWSSKMNEVRATFGYQLQQNIRLAEAVKQSGVVWQLILMLTLGAGAGLGLGIMLYRRAPGSLPEIPVGDRHLAGIQGWLILVALNMALRPPLLFFQSRESFALLNNLPNWITLTDPESFSYNKGFAALASAEFFAIGLFFAWSVVLAAQFFRKKASFPRTVILFLIATICWELIDSLLVGMIQESQTELSAAEKLGAVFGRSLGTFIWVTYFLRSRRVKATFRT